MHINTHTHTHTHIYIYIYIYIYIGYMCMWGAGEFMDEFTQYLIASRADRPANSFPFSVEQ